MVHEKERKIKKDIPKSETCVNHISESYVLDDTPVKSSTGLESDKK